MLSNKFLKLNILSIILLLTSITLNAQLVKITHPNLISESDIYVDENGKRYSDLITVKFVQKLIALPQGQKFTEINSINNIGVRNYFSSLKNKYGDFQIIKVFPMAVWGDTLRINKRTKDVVSIKELSQFFKIEFNRLVPIDSIISAIKQHPLVEYAYEPIQAYTTIEPNDSLYLYGNKWPFVKINAPYAWDITKGLSTVKISVNDHYYGLSQPHIDLAEKIVHHFGEFGGHGQAVAGVAGAMTNNSIGIASLGWNLKIMQHRLGTSYIYDAIQRGADVINFSWITSDYPELRSAIYNAIIQGVICVAAAGNSEWDVPGLRYPAAYHFGSAGQVLAISATKLYDGVEKFVEGWNYSPGGDPINDPENSFIDVAAPGCDFPILGYGTGYGIGCGTSVAAPFVSALSGLILSIDGTLTPVQVYDIITKTADKIGQYTYNNIGWNRYLGYGRINAHNTVNVASGAPNKPQNLTITCNTNSRPLLKWSRNQEPDLTKYKIYKKVTEEWGFQYLTETTDTFYIDNTEQCITGPPIANERIASYRITAVDNTNKESVPSDAASTRVSGPPMEKALSQNTVLNYNLYQNHPNPFNPTTKIKYSIKDDGLVSLKVYDLLGREIVSLVNETMKPGTYEVNLDASRYGLSSGVYLYRLQSGEFIATKKFVYLR